jgi:hypothetical protein
MITPKDLIASPGMTLFKVYYRARKLGLDPVNGNPYRFTRAQARAILNYQAQGKGRPRKAVGA